MTQTFTGTMQIKYSPGVDALYVQLTDGQVKPGSAVRTDDLGGLRHVDYAADGSVIGVEILSPRARGVDLTDVPHAAAIGDELRRLGFTILEPAQAATEHRRRA